MFRSVSALLLVAVALACSACGDDDGVAPDPVISIVEPADGAVIAPNAELVFQVENFVVLPNQEEPNAAGEGHLHIFLDGAYTSFSTVEPVVLSQLGVDGTIAPGNHEITIQLVNNDHTSIEGETAVTTISVTVIE